MRVGRIGVLGAGTMGRGIAELASLAGFETQIYDAYPEAAEAAASAGVRPALELEALAGCQLLIEAAPEDLELKRELLAGAAAACGPETVLASNTSSLRIAEIAAGVPGPERVVGMHFFNPPARMKLVEVVAAEASGEPALAAASEVAMAMGRTPIRARDTPGFVANRLARPFSLESLRMLGDGVADAARIDRIVRLGGGFRMGPFELIDLIGLDVNLTIARSFFTQGGEPERWRPSPIQERLVEEGRLGRKSGQGYHAYGEGAKREPDPDLAISAPTLDPEQLALVDPAAEQVLARLFAQIANETAFALEEKVASPADMEKAMRLGFNWPLGPLGITELIGPGRALQILESLEGEKGGAYSPAPLLRRNISSSS